jgi:hypothetical protein
VTKIHFADVGRRRSAETVSFSSLIARFHALILLQCKRDTLEVVTALECSMIWIVVYLVDVLARSCAIARILSAKSSNIPLSSSPS